MHGISTTVIKSGKRMERKRSGGEQLQRNPNYSHTTENMVLN
jgi:hypothetical protein